jgi:hypothetical protein
MTIAPPESVTAAALIVVPAPRRSDLQPLRSAIMALLRTLAARGGRNDDRNAHRVAPALY